MRILATLLVLLCAGMPGAAQTVEVVLQEGVDGYAGTEDFMMYAPASVAFVNYGASQTLTAGINQWREHYTSIIRFNLQDIPAGAEVVAARLELSLHGVESRTIPGRELTVDLHELAAANADWVEGDGDGTRVPTPGAPCWSHRKHDTEAWAGSPGARTPGVDFRTDWSAQAVVAPNERGWLTFDLPPEAVQRWIDDPRSNAGLHLWPAMAREINDIVYLGSSEHETVEQRPRLALTLRHTDALATALNRALVMRMAADADRRLEHARQAAAPYGPPAATAAGLEAAAQRLADLRVAAAAEGPLDDAATGALTEAARALADEIAALLMRLPMDRARDWNARRGLGAEYALGVESSMVKVFRRDAPFEGEFADRLRVQLARNEREAGQVVVLPVDTDLEQVTWEVRGFGEDGVEVTATPVGYVKSAIPQLVSRPAPSEWWPDPLLDFLRTFDVPRGEAQPLWITVHAAPDARPGRHHGSLVVAAQNAPSQSIDIEVEVFDFALPVEQNLKTIWGMTETNFSRFHGDDYDEEVAWRYFDLFLNSRLAVADLYRTRPTGVRGEDSLWHLANVPALRRLRERGSGWWNVGYVLAPNWALRERAYGVDTYEEYLQLCVEMFREEVARLREADWPQDRMGIYFLDETSDFEALGRAAEVMKGAFPDIPLMTTGYDRGYGLEDTLVSRSMDIWVPLTPRYHEDREKIERGRELGKRVWWYICVGPRDPAALNWFVQYPAIRARLLMGVAARKYEVDGFLYYRMAGWNNNDEPITTGPYTDWIPKYHQTLPDGDGLVICGGPDGPLSTIRLENIRDGIEDYEYYHLLDSRIARASAWPLSAEGRAALDRARALQPVPERILTSVVEYNESPADLLALREEVARAIEALQAHVR